MILPTGLTADLREPPKGKPFMLVGEHCSEANKTFLILSVSRTRSGFTSLTRRRAVIRLFTGTELLFSLGRVPYTSVSPVHCWKPKNSQEQSSARVFIDVTGKA